jgi:hypothetical protein
MDFCIYHLDSDYNKHLKNKFFDNALTSFRERLVSERKVGKGLARWLYLDLRSRKLNYNYDYKNLKLIKFQNPISDKKKKLKVAGY